MRFADIGNSRVHTTLNLYDIEHMKFEEFYSKYKNETLYYISVNHKFQNIIKQNSNWHDLEPFVHMKGFYEGMGIDRRVLSLSKGDGIYIDAGSAITVDVVKESIYRGGMLYPGISALKKAFASISEALNKEPCYPTDTDTLPCSTKEQLGYGIIAPIISCINSIQKAEDTLYITGGDGELLSRYLPKSLYKEGLIFEGMQKVYNSKTEENQC